MTGRDGMTDKQVRAALERIDPKFSRDFDHFPSDYYREALRLLAEFHAALGRIARKTPGIKESFEGERNCPHCEYMIDIARTAVKGGK